MNARALVAWNLRRIRGEKGVSQERLAADANVDRAYMSEIERETANVTVDVLDRLAASLAVDVAALFAVPSPDAQPPEPLKAGRKPKG